MLRLSARITWKTKRIIALVLIAKAESDSVSGRDDRILGLHMRFLLAFSVLCCAIPAYADSIWYSDQYPGDQILSGCGATREIHIEKDAETKGEIVFKGTADGRNYTGTAYIYTKSCGRIEFEVSGQVRILPDADGEHHASIDLTGQMPELDSQCKNRGTVTKVVQFKYLGCHVGFTCQNCNCGGDKTPELRPAFHEVGDPTYGEKAHVIGGARCPYLYAWKDNESHWETYGKMIHGAENRDHERTEVVPLSSFATKFRLAEEEPETSFIDDINLKVRLRNGSEITLEPQFAEGGLLHEQIRIAPFTEVKFFFSLPPTVKEADVEKASLSMTGYYEVVKPADVAAEH
jgi:hypothetical protein